MSEILIDGSWGPAQSRAEQMVYNPSTLKPIFAAPFSDAQDVVLAMAAARRATERWGTLAREARTALLVEAGHALAASAPEVAELQSQESGQPRFECLEAVHAAARCFTRIADPRGRNAPTPAPALRVRAAGVQPLLLDPDYPLLDWACRAVPLLEAGSTLVCAVPRATPLSVLRALRCTRALPRGVLNMVVASPEAVSAAVGASRVENARYAGSEAGSQGVDAVFLSASADLEYAVSASAWLRLFHGGQRAGQSARIYAAERISGRVADRLHEYLAFLECGDPSNPATDLGPLRSSTALQRVEDQVGRALKRGALLKLGGRRYQPWGLRGYFFQPTLVIEGRGDERVPDAQIRGPVVIVSPVRSLAEAVGQERLRRISFFGDDLDEQLPSLSAAGADFELAEATTPLERILQDLQGSSVGRLRIERWAGDERSGFPYGPRVPGG